MSALYATLNGISARFIGEGPFFAGSELTLVDRVDRVLIAWVSRFCIAESAEQHRGFSRSQTEPKFQGTPLSFIFNHPY
jgi:glutathione S-transferase